MTNSYLYSIKVNEALERYGAKTHGSLARRVERLKRFTDMKNRKYAEEIRLEDARMIANQEREERVKNRVRELLRTPSPRRKEWHSNYTTKPVQRNLNEEFQEVEIPTTPSHSYNLRPREENGLNLLWRAIQNGFVNTNRG